MRDEKKQERHQAIMEAAYGLLAEKGYAGTSMLNIAKSAKASNETLYRWYGEKRGLFLTMVEANAGATENLLSTALENGKDPMATLKEVAPIFLAMLLGDRAILLNRAAAADTSGALGTAISKGGRDVIQPLFSQLIEATGKVPDGRLAETTNAFVSLLIGDTQIKRVIGVMNTPTDREITSQCAQAFQNFETILNAT